MTITTWVTIIVIAICISSFITQRQINNFEEKFFNNFWLNKTNDFIKKYYKPSILYKVIRELKEITVFEWVRFKDKEIQKLIDDFQDVESKKTYFMEEKNKPIL